MRWWTGPSEKEGDGERRGMRRTELKEKGRARRGMRVRREGKGRY